MQNQIRILSTKKLLSNQKQFLLNANFSVVEADFIKTENKPFELKAINHNLIFTSQNAVHSLVENAEELLPKLQEKNVFCVGLKTKALLEENGFNVIAYTGYAADLAEIIALIYSKESFTFFSGNLRRDTLPNYLKEANIKFNEIEVYETHLTPQKINTPVDGILFFSPSAVESYLKDNKIKKETCFCIGNTTAEALEKTTKNIIVANQPTVENTIIQCINKFK
ncbi:uroporphyrinogen-III synthase [Flavobacterium arsenatis]|uniref:Uroporphyrinogen-III synthase n=1 Tax=Flavobacterium arsenatis TaxID=1484332 RepID=A0ABU1TT51_9FLAO|nr:uroporphyrinogen-III synthase [Flavobacterium arsenatis]MDR6969040.1 uroporphyrinogen-III synthase [Flavobacterium arsenatis]